MKAGTFKLNSKIKILYDEEEYSSNVQDVSNESISISIPVNNGSYLSLREGEEVTAIYYGPSEIYEFHTEVIGREKNNNVPIIFLKQPKSLKKIQRRKFVRISHTMKAFYKKVNVELEKEKMNNLDREDMSNFNSILMIDLSGGGCKIKTTDKLNFNDTIRLKFFIEEECINVNCKIVRIEKSEDGQYEYGILFLDINEHIREKIIRYIFGVMRQQRKRGLKC